MMKNKIFSILIILTLIAQPLAYAQENAPVVMPPAAAPVINPDLASSKITLDIKGMDIIDVLKMLSSRSGMNIVVGKNVAGRVTLFLKDVPVEDAFEIILLSNELAFEKKGGIVNVMTQRDYELLYGQRFQDQKQAVTVRPQYAKAADLARALNQIKTNLGRVVVDEGSNTLVMIDSPDTLKQMQGFINGADLPIETRVFSLNYSTADKLSPKLQEVITKGVGSIKIDERSNKIAITDYPARLDEIAKVIEAFDERPLQVLIDAQIIEVKPSDQFQMGVNWEYFIKEKFDFKTNLPVTTQNILSIGAAAAGGAGAVLAAGQYKGIIDILRTVGEVNILSSPRIMAVNNQEAKIHIGRRDAYITSTTSQGGSGNTVTSQSVNFVDVGIQLRVTPSVSKDGFVTMKIKPEVSDAVPKLVKSQDQDTEIPIVSTSETETTVMVKDGVTIIIGGLAQDKKSKTVKKIPILGDIPLLGAIFRNTDEKVEKDELVILLTPHIMSGEKSYVDFSEIPPVEGAVARMEKGKIITEKIAPKALSNQNSPEGSVSAYYLSLLDKVNRSVSQNIPPNKLKGKVKLIFRVSSDGSLVGQPTVAGQAQPGLDDCAVKAVKSASPFAPLPPELRKSEEDFRVTLEYK
ncbi:MAG: TonB family protein [Candidatus Omnitrophota bacterium]|nr:TonB family protein [Candidatus Omnitrophota bacterium]